MWYWQVSRHLDLFRIGQLRTMRGRQVVRHYGHHLLLQLCGRDVQVSFHHCMSNVRDQRQFPCRQRRRQRLRLQCWVLGRSPRYYGNYFDDVHGDEPRP